MFDAIRCRLKMLMWLVLFFAPVAIAAWGTLLDRQMNEDAYLPAPDFTPIAFAYE